jgi:hypothetical protein
MLYIADGSSHVTADFCDGKNDYVSVLTVIATSNFQCFIRKKN